MYISLKIMQINNFNEYILQDKDTDKRHQLVLEFHGISPKVDDMIVLDERLLDPKSDLYIKSYAFEAINDDKTAVSGADLAGLITKDKEYVLKRMYG